MLGNIKVVSKRNLNPELGWTDIYVGRPSPLGNPYPLKNEADRRVVVKQYRRWLWNQIKWADDPNHNHAAYLELIRITELVRQGSNVRLVCWCAPKACHADIIVRAINWLLTQ